MIGGDFALAFANDGRLLLANVWKFGKIAPTEQLLDWLDFATSRSRDRGRPPGAAPGPGPWSVRLQAPLRRAAAPRRRSPVAG